MKHCPKCHTEADWEFIENMAERRGDLREALRLHQDPQHQLLVELCRALIELRGKSQVIEEQPFTELTEEELERFGWVRGMQSTQSP